MLIRMKHSGKLHFSDSMHLLKVLPLFTQIVLRNVGLSMRGGGLTAVIIHRVRKSNTMKD